MPNNSARKDEIAKHFAEFMWYHLARTQTSMHVPTRAALEQALTSYEEERGEGWQQRIWALRKDVPTRALTEIEEAEHRGWTDALNAVCELFARQNAKDALPPSSLVAPIDYEQLDPGVRDLVKRLREAGFETTDSGDGVSKPVEERAFDCLHVAAVVRAEDIVPESHRFHAIVGDGWHVEATYFPQSGTTLLLGTLGAVPQVTSERDAYAVHMARHAKDATPPASRGEGAKS
jgi:hypothetical protein